MDFRFANLKWLPVAVALSAAVLPAMAQNGAAPAGQAILFSTPAGDDATANAPVAPDSTPHDFADSFQAPVSLFNEKSSESFSLPSGGPVSSSHDRRLHKTLEDRQNWALLTPEEILGVATPEQILGNDPQDQENQNPSDRFLTRQQMVATNSVYNNNPDFSGDGNDANATVAARLNAADASQFLNRFGSALPASNPFAAQNQDSSWFKAAAPAVPKPDPEQLAAMDRFRQLLNSGSTADAPDKSSAAGKFLSAQQSLRDPNGEGLPVANRIGTAFTSLTSGISKPTGLTPLPGITQPIMVPVVTPSWAPQPPPWLSQNPQPFTMPQRKF